MILWQVLEEEVVAAIGNHGGASATTNVEFNGRSTSERKDVSLADNFRQENEEDSMMNFATAAGAMFSLNVSLDGVISKSLEYHAWQVRALCVFFI